MLFLNSKLYVYSLMISSPLSGRGNAQSVVEVIGIQRDTLGAGGLIPKVSNFACFNQNEGYY